MITILALIISIVGALNWLAIGVFNFNIVAWIFGANMVVGARIVYILVGIAGVWLIGYTIRRLVEMSKKKKIEEQ